MSRVSYPQVIGVHPPPPWSLGPPPTAFLHPPYCLDSLHLPGWLQKYSTDAVRCSSHLLSSTLNNRSDNRCSCILFSSLLSHSLADEQIMVLFTSSLFLSVCVCTWWCPGQASVMTDSCNSETLARSRPSVDHLFLGLSFSILSILVPSYSNYCSLYFVSYWFILHGSHRQLQPSLDSGVVPKNLPPLLQELHWFRSFPLLWFCLLKSAGDRPFSFSFRTVFPIFSRFSDVPYCLLPPPCQYLSTTDRLQHTDACKGLTRKYMC